MIWTTQPRSNGAGAIAYVATGDGPPLVLIHGVGLRAEAWAAMQRDLSARYRVYATDMPGHRASPLNGAAELGDYVLRYTDFLRDLEAPAALVGHSMGAMIALELACHAPNSVTGVAALNAIFKRSPEAATSVQTRAAELATNPNVSPEPTLNRWFGETPHAHADAAEACRTWLTQADPTGYANAYGIFAHHDGPKESQLQGLQMPTLFMTGENDPNSTTDMSRKMAELAPQGTAQIIKGAAHMMPMTHPKMVTDALFAKFKFKQS